jgi:hypothetical protein
MDNRKYKIKRIMKIGNVNIPNSPSQKYEKLIVKNKTNVRTNCKGYFLTIS